MELANRAEQEIRNNLAQFIAAHSSDVQHPTYQNIINIYYTWLALPTDQRRSWAETQLEIATDYDPSGNLEKDNQMRATKNIASYLLGILDLVP